MDSTPRFDDSSLTSVNTVTRYETRDPVRRSPSADLQRSRRTTTTAGQEHNIAGVLETDKGGTPTLPLAAVTVGLTRPPGCRSSLVARRSPSAARRLSLHHQYQSAQVVPLKHRQPHHPIATDCVATDGPTDRSTGPPTDRPADRQPPTDRPADRPTLRPTDPPANRE